MVKTITPIDRLLNRYNIGVRAAGMFLTGSIWFVIGLDLLVSPPRVLAPAVFHQFLPMPLRLAIWWVPALVAFWLARDDSRSHIGLGFLMVSPIERAVSFLVGMISVPLHHLWPWWPAGDPRAWLTIQYYLLMIALVYLLALIPANVRPPLTGPEGPEAGLSR